MKECEHLPAGIRRICEGQGGLTLERVNAYREKYGVETLEALPEGAVVHEVETMRSTRAAFSHPDPKGSPHGPGTELKKIFEAVGVPTCQACQELTTMMNQWGVAGCRQRIESIVNDILPRAKDWMKDNRPWIHALLPNAVEDWGIRQRIRGYITEAIEAAERKESAKKKSQDEHDPPGQSP
jgi:hypothetical protein